MSDKLMIELFNRIKVLEEKVLLLEEKLDLKEDLIEADYLHQDSSEEESKFTRNTGRKYVIEQLMQHNSNLQVSKGNRAVNADILITEVCDSVNRYIKVKYYHSKSHVETFASGWHTVAKEDIENNNYDIFIFTVEYKAKFHTFLFFNDELESFLIGKPMDKSLKYHLYFRVVGNKIIECRDGERDALRYYNRWLLPTEIIDNN